MAAQPISREHELTTIAGFVETLAGGPAALVVEGEAGIGKTTVWNAAVEAASAAGLGVLAARPAEAEATGSFVGLADLLDPILETVRPELPPPQRRALDAALLLADAERDVDRLAIGRALLAALRAFVRDGPGLVAIDDVQWLDPPSTAALAFALRRLRDEPVGLLVTRRTEAAPALDLEAAFPPGRHLRLAVPPLSLGALRQLLLVRLGAAFRRPVLRKLHDASHGNPLFALELGRALLERGGELDAGELPVPVDLQALLASRLDRLPAPTRQALLVAATVAQPTEELVYSVLGEGGLDGIEDAAAAGVVELHAGSIRFGHPLLAAALRAQTPVRRRRDVHRRLAAATVDLEQRARHLALATAAVDAAVASTVEAGVRAARARGASEAAAELAEHALRLTPAELGSECARRRVDAAGEHARAGNFNRADALLREGLAASPTGPVRARLLWKLGTLESERGRAEKGMHLLRAALAEAGVADADRAWIAHELAWVTSVADAVPHALPHARAALELAERSGDEAVRAQASATLALMLFWTGSGIQHELMDRAIAIEDALESAGTPIAIDQRPSITLALQLQVAGDFERSRSLLERARARAAELDDPALVVILFFLGSIEIRTGDWDRAERYAAAMREVAAEIGGDATGGFCVEAHVAALRGDFDAARAAGDTAWAEATHGGNRTISIYAQAIRGFVELSMGNPTAAHDELGAAHAQLWSMGFREPAFMSFLPFDLEALISLGRLDEARPKLEWLERQAAAIDRPWALAVAARCRGLLRAAEQDVPGALSAFADALDHHRRVPQPFERAYTELAYGEALRRAGKRREGRAILESARATFEELGARVWAERAHEALARIGGRAPSRDALTQGEQRVAALVARGMTNKEVAAALFVSDRTVESHLSRIYAKLGVRSRTELARANTGGFHVADESGSA